MSTSTASTSTTSRMNAAPNVELYNCLSMIPGIPYAIFHIYKMGYSWSIASPLLYIVLCVNSCVHHLYAHVSAEPSMFLLKVDLNTQLIACMFTSLFATYGLRGSILILAILAFEARLKLESDLQRCACYALNGVSVIISSGAHASIVAHWMGSFALFAIGILFKNEYTHSLFHLYNHANMGMVWTFFLI